MFLIKKNNKGFTLVEMLIAMSLGVAIIGGTFSVYNTQQKTYVSQDQISGIQQNARMAIDVMTREIRMAGYNPTQANISPIVYATETSLQFNIDSGVEDGVLDDVNEVITYIYENNAIKRTTNTNGQEILIENVSGFSFNYGLIADGTGPCSLDGNGTSFGISIDDDNDNIVDEVGEIFTTAFPGLINSCTLDQIRTIQINITVDSEKSDPSYTNPYNNSNYRSVQLVSTISPRNLGF